MHITDIYDRPKKDQALKEALKLQKQKHITIMRKIILATAGGDGSLMYIAQDADDIGIDLNDITLCVLPYGTGNDFAKTLGWGTSPKPEWTSKLSTLGKAIVNA